MDRGAKPATAKVTSKRPVASRARTPGNTAVRALEQRLAAALEQQAATNEILRVMAVSRNDVQPVLDAVAEQAARLCKAPYARIFLVEGDALRIAADYSLARDVPIPVLPVSLRRSSVSGRAVIDAEIVHHADVTRLLDTEFPDTRDNAQLIGCRAALAVPLMREGSADGAIFLWRREPGLFAPDEVALVQTFARQAAIAIENARLFTELQTRNHDISEALEQQTATSDILRVIASSPTEAQPVFNAIARDALRLCDADYSVVGRYDGEMLHLVAHEHVRAEGVQVMLRLFPLAPNRATTMTRAILDRAVVHVPDVLEDPDYDRTVARGITNRSTLGVPMLRDGSPIGAISVGRLQPRPFTDKQIALVQTFADQAVIAIENVRLFKELEAKNRDLTEALEQQTATSEILRVISQSQTDVQPVFDTIAQRAGKLCDAEVAVVSRFDGTVIELAAIHGLVPDGVKLVRGLYPMKIDAQTVTSRVIRNNAVIHYADVLAEPSYEIKDFARAARYRSALGVPIVRNGKVIGSIFVGRLAPGHFSDSQIELLKTFSEQAVIAIENVRLFTELEARNKDLTQSLEQQTATSEILRAISQSQTDVRPVFDTIAQRAGKLCDAEVAVVSRFDGSVIELAAIHGVVPDAVKLIRELYPLRIDSHTVSARVIRSGAVVHYADVLADPSYATKEFARAARYRGALGVPIVRDAKIIGSIFVGRSAPGLFSESQIELLKTFSEQAVIAIENVRLFKELEARTTQLTRSVGELKALGEVGQAVSSTLDLETVLRTIVARATKLAGMDGGSIYEYDEAREEFHLHTTDRLPAEVVEALSASPIPKGEGALGQLAVTGDVVAISDITDERVYRSRVRKMLLRTGYRSLLAVPLLREDHLLGGLVVNRKTPGEFAPEVVDLLKTFATQSALAIQNARLFREIGDKSRELEIASRHKSEFLANMSHELRTPLNAIIGFSEVLADRMFGEINDKQAEYLADILESGRHLLSLINDILDLSKIEAGRMELDLDEFNLPTAIDNTVTLIRERAHRRGITLERAIGERVGVVRADERKVKQVLLNLLSNALKFTPEGGRISVRSDVRDGVAEVSVTDTGIGIAASDQAAVFEEFRQVGTTAKKVEGTGLGLAISRKFIELHGGTIWVKSDVGAGSTFAFTLPILARAR